MSLTGRLRLPLALLLAWLALLTLPGVGAAKTPPFTVEVTPPRPVSGEPITVIVRFSEWSPSFKALDGLVAFQLDGGGEEVPVSFARLEDRSYRAEVVLPAGSWTLVPFPDNPLPEAVPGYPEPIPVRVAATAQVPATAAAPAWLFIGAAVALVAGLALAIGRFTRNLPHGSRGTLAKPQATPAIDKPSR